MVRSSIIFRMLILCLGVFALGISGRGTAQSFVSAQDGFGIVDVATGLEWLPLRYTLGFNYAELFVNPDYSKLAAYGITPQYRLAQDAEVQQLLLDLGFPYIPTPTTLDPFGYGVVVNDDGALARTFIHLLGYKGVYQSPPAVPLQSVFFETRPPDFAAPAGNSQVVSYWTIAEKEDFASQSITGSDISETPYYGAEFKYPTYFLVKSAITVCHPVTGVRAMATLNPCILRYNGWGSNPQSRGVGVAAQPKHVLTLKVINVPKAMFRVFVKPISKSGGHEHDIARRHGWLRAAYSAAYPPFATNGSGNGGTTDYSDYEHGLLVTADAKGIAKVYYYAPEVSGKETVTFANATNPNQTYEQEIAISIPDLQPVTVGINFGQKSWHPVNNFGAASLGAALAAAEPGYRSLQHTDTELNGYLTQLAAHGYDFPATLPAELSGSFLYVPRDPETLFLNDISLPNGGLFDVGQDWTPDNGGHIGHREGKHIDIKSTHLIAGTPYTLSGTGQAGPQTVTVAGSWKNAVSDSRLTVSGGSAPFRNIDPLRNADGNPVFDTKGKPLYYTTAIRGEMNLLVQHSHYRRLQLLIQTLQSPSPGMTGVFAPEGDHIHVQYE